MIIVVDVVVVVVVVAVVVGRVTVYSVEETWLQLSQIWNEIVVDVVNVVNVDNFVNVDNVVKE